MSRAASFKHRLAKIHDRCAKAEYDAALEDLDALRRDWPGNAQVELLWATVVQLQHSPAHSLEEVKSALQRAVELEPNSPAPPLEFGHYLDNVEDNPKAAAKAFGEAADSARRMLIDALLGRAAALLQLGRKAEAVQCLAESLYLTNTAKPAPDHVPSIPDVVTRDNAGWLHLFRLQGPFAIRIDELLQELSRRRSA